MASGKAVQTRLASMWVESAKGTLFAQRLGKTIQFIRSARTYFPATTHKFIHSLELIFTDKKTILPHFTQAPVATTNIFPFIKPSIYSSSASLTCGGITKGLKK